MENAKKLNDFSPIRQHKKKKNQKVKISLTLKAAILCRGNPGSAPGRSATVLQHPWGLVQGLFSLFSLDDRNIFSSIVGSSRGCGRCNRSLGKTFVVAWSRLCIHVRTPNSSSTPRSTAVGDQAEERLSTSLLRHEF